MIDFDRVQERALKQVDAVHMMGGGIREAVGRSLAAEGFESHEIKGIWAWLDACVVEHAAIVDEAPESVMRGAIGGAFIVGYFLGLEAAS